MFSKETRVFIFFDFDLNEKLGTCVRFGCNGLCLVSIELFTVEIRLYFISRFNQNWEFCEIGSSDQCFVFSICGGLIRNRMFKAEFNKQNCFIFTSFNVFFFFIATETTFIFFFIIWQPTKQGKNNLYIIFYLAWNTITVLRKNKNSNEKQSHHPSNPLEIQPSSAFP